MRGGWGDDSLYRIITQDPQNLCVLWCAVKRLKMQLMEVQPEELLVRLGSYPRDAGGDKRVEAAETESCERQDRKRTSRNVSEARASLARENAGADLFRGQRRPSRWTSPIITNMEVHLPAGVVSPARTQASSGDTGDLSQLRSNARRRERRPGQESEGLVVPMKSVNADGGKGPWFRVWFGEPRVWRST